MKERVTEQQKAETHAGTNLTSQFFSNFIDNSQINNSGSQISEGSSIRLNYSVNQIQIKAFQMQNLMLICSSVSKRQYIDRWIQNKEYVKLLEKRTPQYMTKIFLKIFYTMAIKLQVKYSWIFRTIKKYAQTRPIIQKTFLTPNMHIGIGKLQKICSKTLKRYFDYYLKCQTFRKIYKTYELKHRITKIIDIAENSFTKKLQIGWINIQNFISFQNKLHILIGTINLTLHPPMRETFWFLRKNQLPFQNPYLSKIKGIDQNYIQSKNITVNTIERQNYIINGQKKSEHQRKKYKLINHQLCQIKEPILKYYSVKTYLQDDKFSILMNQQGPNKLFKDIDSIICQKSLRNEQVRKQINDFSDIFNIQQITSVFQKMNCQNTKTKKMISLANLKRKNQRKLKKYRSEDQINFLSINMPLFAQSSLQISNKINKRNIFRQNDPKTKQKILMVNRTNFSKEKEKKQKRISYSISNNKRQNSVCISKSNLFTKKYAQKVKKTTNSFSSFKTKTQIISKKEQIRSNSKLKKSNSIKKIKEQSFQKIQHKQFQDDYQYFTTRKEKNKQKSKHQKNNEKKQYFLFAKEKINKQNPLK